MDIIKHTGSRNEVSVFGSLSNEVDRLIRDCWSSGSLNNGVQQVLQAVHEQDCWLACDCLKSEGQHPILFVRKSRDGLFSLVRSSRRGEHAPSCEFCWEEGELGVARHRRSSAGAEFAWKTYEGLLVPPKRTTAAIVHAGKSEDVWLARALKHVLSECVDQCVVDSNELPDNRVSAGYRAIREWLREPRQAQINLSEQFWLDEEVIFSGHAVRFLRQDSAETSAGLKRVGYLLILPQSIRDNSIYTRSYHYRVEGSINFLGEAVDSGPMVGLIKVRADEDGKRCRFEQAVIASRLMGTWAVVANAHQRSVLLSLGWCVRKAKESGLPLRLEASACLPVEDGALPLLGIFWSGEASLQIVGPASSDPRVGTAGNQIQLASFDDAALRQVMSEVMRWVRSLPKK